MTDWSLADAKAEFRPVEVTTSVCFDGSISSEIERLEGELPAVQAADDRENRNPQAPALAKQIAALYEKAKDAERPFIFVGIGHRAWSDLLRDHPPTAQQKKDGLDHDPDRFPAAAIAAACKSPSLTEEDVRWLADHLSLGQFRKLWQACLAANIAAVDRPKSMSPSVSRLVSGPRQSSRSERVEPAVSSSDE